MVPFLETFDYTDTAESLGTRPVTTVAPQALLLLNSEFAYDQANALADRVRREAGDDRTRQVERLFRLAVGRAPNHEETKIADRLLARRRAGDEPDAESKSGDELRRLCLVVLNLNEFVYVD
jgi:hypothetical protein